MLSITTDYATSIGDPSPYLRRIADAGFTHLHWCHQWNTDFLYSEWEVDQIECWLNDFGLQLLDLHASVGPEKNWYSGKEYERLSGVELVKNRIDMTSRLGGGVIIMHIPKDPHCVPLRKSMDELQPFARERGVRVAVENGDFGVIRQLLSEYGPEFLGVCYDSGHGNSAGDGQDNLETCKDRLISLHMNDNDASGDQHQPLFMGTVDWDRMAGIIATSSYEKCVSMEVVMKNAGIEDEDEFLAHVLETGTRFAGMVEERRKANGLR